MPSKILVSDTNIWIDLHHGGLLDAAFELPYQFVTSEFAYFELHKPPGQALEERGLAVQGFAPEELQVLFELKKERHNPSLADVSCYLIARENGWLLVTGDKKLRVAGQGQKLEVRGVLWILDELFRLDVVRGPDLAAALQAMLDRGARLPDTECNQRIKKWSNH